MSKSEDVPQIEIDYKAIEGAVRTILKAVGEDPDREGLLETPARVSRMYAEMFSGLREDPRLHLKKVFTEKYDEVVIVRDIMFASMCEHHLLPFTGKAHIGYIPDGRVVGLSKLARLVEGSHSCMTIRGVRKPGSLCVTSALKGIFRSNQASRAEILELINRQS